MDVHVGRMSEGPLQYKFNADAPDQGVEEGKY